MKHIVTQEDIDSGRFTGVEVGHEMEVFDPEKEGEISVAEDKEAE